VTSLKSVVSIPGEGVSAADVPDRLQNQESRGSPNKKGVLRTASPKLPTSSTESPFKSTLWPTTAIALPARTITLPTNASKDGYGAVGKSDTLVGRHANSDGKLCLQLREGRSRVSVTDEAISPCDAFNASFGDQIVGNLSGI
jgi:hypothetical protein